MPPHRPSLAAAGAAAHVAASIGDGRVRMAWVLTEEHGRVHVGRYFSETGEPAKPRPRNPTCLACGARVRLRLGKVRAPHAAHAPDASCVLQVRESAIHFNVKCELAARLIISITSGLPLQVAQRCVVGRRHVAGPGVDRTLEAALLPEERCLGSCDAEVVRTWLPQWTRVEVEARVWVGAGARVPDLVLYDGDVPVGIIEVRHTHPVDDEKAEALARLGLQWVEVEASATAAQLDLGWHPKRPLSVYRVSGADPWRCPAHAAMVATWRDAALRRTALLSVKLVELLLPDGARERCWLAVEEDRYDGEPQLARLRLMAPAGTETLAEHPYSETPSAEDRRAVATEFAARGNAVIAALAHSRAGRADSPMGWAKGALAEALLRARSDRLEMTHPCRFLYRRATRTWAWANGAESLRWDRPPSDELFDFHQDAERLRRVRAAAGGIRDSAYPICNAVRVR